MNFKTKTFGDFNQNNKNKVTSFCCGYSKDFEGESCISLAVSLELYLVLNNFALNPLPVLSSAIGPGCEDNLCFSSGSKTLEVKSNHIRIEKKWKNSKRMKGVIVFDKRSTPHRLYYFFCREMK